MSIKVLGIDIAKNTFQLHGTDDAGKAVLKKHLSRNRLSPYVANLHCPSRKLISRTVTPPTVRNDDVDHRLVEFTRPFQEQVAAPIATQDYPFPVTDACASNDNNQNSGSRFVSNDARSTR